MKISIKKYHDRLVKEAREKKADEILDERLAKKCENVDVTILYTLHTVFGFGAKRCHQFYFEMINNHFNMCNQFQCNGDDSHYWVMKERLKLDGIDVEAFINEANERRKWREKNEN